MNAEDLYTTAKLADWQSAVRAVEAATKLDSRHARGFVLDCKQGYMTTKRLALLPMKTEAK